MQPIDFCSVAILRYLSSENEIPDHLYPKDIKARARVDEYLEWQHNNIRTYCSLYFRIKVNINFVKYCFMNVTFIFYLVCNANGNWGTSKSQKSSRL